MKVILSKGLSWGWVLLAISTILMAIIIATARFTLPFVKDYRGEIQSQLSTLLKRPVEIGSIDVAWEGLHPVVAFRDVTIRDKSEQQDVFHFDSLSLSLHLRESLRQLRPVLRTLFLRGGDIAVRRTLDGRFVFKGLSGFNRPIGDSSEGLEAFEHLSLRLSDIHLIWQDEPLQRNWEFYSEGMDLVVWDGGVSVNAELTLPEEMGSKLTVTAIALGDLRDYRGWNGHFFLDLESLNLAAYPLEWPDSAPEIKSGSLATRLWGNWQGLTTFEAEGTLTAEGIQIVPPRQVLAATDPVNASAAAPREAVAAALPDDNEVLDIAFLRSRIRWEQQGRRWHLDMDKTRVSVDDHVWPVTALSLERPADDPSTQALRFSLAYADIGSLARVARLLPALKPAQRVALTEMEPRGTVRDVSGHVLRHGGQWRYDIEGELANLGWFEYGKIPGIEGISASLHANEREGWGTLRIDSGLFETSRWFEAPFDVARLTTELSWTQNPQGWDVLADDIKLGNDDLNAFGTARVVRQQGQKPELYLDLGIPEVPLDRVEAYLPYGILKPKTADWLRGAFLAGKGHDGVVSYAGVLDKEAFRRGVPELRADFGVEGGHLHYQQGFPDIHELAGRFHFHNASLQAEIESGDILGASIGQGKVEIENFYQARLLINAHAEGELPQYLDYLKQSRLSKGKEKFLASVASAGNAGLDLALDIPLSKAIGEPLTLDGRLRLRSNRLAMPEHDLEFTKVKGLIHFTEKAYGATGLSGMFRGEPVAAGIVTRDDDTVVVSVLGDFSVSQLLPEQAELLRPWVSGIARWDVRVEVPISRHGEDVPSPLLRVESDLRGIDIALPEPAGKRADGKRALELSWELGVDLAEVDVRYADLARAKALMHSEQGRQKILRAELLLGPTQKQPSLSGDGIGISGELDRIDLNQWISAILEMRREDGEGLDIRAANVHVRELAVVGQTIRDLDVLVARKPAGWQLDLNSSQVAGDIYWPDGWKQRAPVTAKLDHLILKRNGGDVESALRPRDLPSLEVVSKKFQWGDIQFDRTVLSAVRSDLDWIIKKARFESDTLMFDASGAWLDNGEGKPRTRLRLTADGADLGASIADLDLTAALGNGSGSLEADINWAGPPYLPDFASMEGTVSLNVRDGRLKDIDPGLGRLLGLLNLDSLPKRLALNFKDISVEGFQYDTIVGEGSLANGVLYLDELVMDGSAATISIAGNTHLVKHEYDLDVNLVPKFKSAVPLMAGALVAPQTGVVLYVADKLAEALGVDFNESATITYKVTGTWEDPQVETVQEAREAQDSAYDLPG